MAVRWYSTVIDSTDPRALADWWAAALGWQKATKPMTRSSSSPPTSPLN
jgi:Glyoxalase-like domain